MISTPIYYINGEPHIGTLYSTVLADFFTRWEKVKGNNPYFTTGTDEHGSKVYQAAQKSGLDPKKYCDFMSSKFENMCSPYSIEYNRFIRTTDKDHIETVQNLWNQLYSKGLIYKGEYKSWYCRSDESYLTQSQITKEKIKGVEYYFTKDTYKQVEWISEINYKFKLSQFKDEIRKWLLSKDDIITPKSQLQNILNILDNEDISDLSISRSKSKVPWGIDVPNDNTQTIYVWFDALLNYITSSYKINHWPPYCNIIGKDILKFHTIYYPAILMGLGYKLPQHILIHNHWTVNKQKMSKSLGNVILPGDLLKQFRCDIVRYYLLRNSNYNSDSDFNISGIKKINNTELADIVGNLISRSFSPILLKYCNGVISKDRVKLTDADLKLIEYLKNTKENVKKYYDALYYYKGIDELIKYLREVNKYIATIEPWKIVNNQNLSAIEKGNQLSSIFYCICESIKMAGVFLYPVMPSCIFFL